MESIYYPPQDMIDFALFIRDLEGGTGDEEFYYNGKLYTITELLNIYKNGSN